MTMLISKEQLLMLQTLKKLIKEDDKKNNPQYRYHSASAIHREMHGINRDYKKTYKKIHQLLEMGLIRRMDRVRSDYGAFTQRYQRMIGASGAVLLELDPDGIKELIEEYKLFIEQLEALIE